MALIWKRSSATVSELEAELNVERDPPLSYKTFLTICSRLTDKGLLRYTTEGRSFRYSPTMDRTTFIEGKAGQETDALLDRYGELAVASFVDHLTVRPELLTRLRELLDLPEQ